MATSTLRNHDVVSRMSFRQRFWSSEFRLNPHHDRSNCECAHIYVLISCKYLFLFHVWKINRASSKSVSRSNGAEKNVWFFVKIRREAYPVIGYQSAWAGSCL